MRRPEEVMREIRSVLEMRLGCRNLDKQARPAAIPYALSRRGASGEAEPRPRRLAADLSETALKRGPPWVPPRGPYSGVKECGCGPRATPGGTRLGGLRRCGEKFSHTKIKSRLQRVQMDKLTPAAKLVVTYMALQHLLRGRGYVTIKELQAELQISQRRLRSVLAELRRRGLVKVYMDPAQGRLHLYALAFDNFELDVPAVRPGVYYIDLPPETKIPYDLTFRAYSIIRASDLLLYTPTFENKKRLFYLTRCVCTIRPYTPETIEEARQEAERGKVVAVIYSSQADKVKVPEDSAMLQHIQIAIRTSPRLKAK